MRCFQIRISGEIQGEGLRFSTMHHAYRHGIKGFVKYSKPNEILIEAEGAEEQLEPFIKYCQSTALSSKLHTTDNAETEVKGYQSFEIVASINGEADSLFKSIHQTPIMSFLKKHLPGCQIKFIFKGLLIFF
jgi:acylphosphatase